MENQAYAASSTSAPSCPASTSYPHYDVFTNHRGPDVKNTFDADLYRRLVEKGLRVFLDKPEMMPGQPINSQILAAIEICHVQVAIFSQGYAQSNWCMDELKLMLKTTERAINRATILPVFYKVEPSHLRYRVKGSYAEALSNHEKEGRYDSDTIESWRKALFCAADISGFELDGDEDELLRRVVQGVLKNVPKSPKVVQGVLENVAKPLFEVAEYPTGVEEKFEELQEKLREFEMKRLNEDNGRMRAKVVGIVGFGGVGKTTLAKLFFNRMQSNYKESSFLFEVRETAARNSLSYLQSKLLRDLKYQGDTKIDNHEEGKVRLKQHISSCRFLIIIDDIDDAMQLKALVPVDVLSPESLILVTTRDKHVLEVSGVSWVYEMKGLNTLHSNELFCSYAFHQLLPPTEFVHLVDRFVNACDGLLLSLKVIGALLCGENEQYWEEQLVLLSQTLPDEIQKRLRISYDSLCKQDQPIFLDIACFCLGGNKDRAIRLWGLVAIRNLENKCLLEVDSENKLKMHDHIRDCARSIAQEESMPLRLWYQTPTNVMDALSEKSSSVEIEVRGIATMADAFKSDDNNRLYGYDCEFHDMKESEIEQFNNSGFRGMKNLRFVATEGASLEAMLRRLHSPQLSCLRWYGCSCSSLPDWIPMKNLRVLDVQGNDMESLWLEQSQGPLELRELRINAPLSNFPKSIGQLQHLEWIGIWNVLSYWGMSPLRPILPEEWIRIINDSSYRGGMSPVRPITVETLPEEFCRLHSLKYLVLQNFSKLISLPDSFGKRTNLQHIELQGASSLQRLPNSFGNLTRLKYLCLSRCSNLTISNGALANIARLEYLSLKECREVKELPPRVAHLRSLKKLNLERTNLKELPCGIGDLCNLEILKIGNESLELLPSSLVNLKSLKDFSSGIEYLPQDLPKFNNLQSLYVSHCPLREISFLRGEGEAEISSLEGRSGWNKLDSANDKCMFGLTHLMLVQTQISEVAFFNGVCPNLINLNVLGNLKLKSIQGLGQLTNIKRLFVNENHEIEELAGVEHCMSLQFLGARDCPKLRWGGVLQQLRRRVEYLWIDVQQYKRRKLCA